MENNVLDLRTEDEVSPSTIEEEIPEGMKTIDEIVGDIYNELNKSAEAQKKFADTQINLSLMLKTWYLKLDLMSRVIQEVAKKNGISEVEFKEIAEKCFDDIKSEIAIEESKNPAAKPQIIIN